jgi:hypothetical protein
MARMAAPSACFADLKAFIAQVAAQHGADARLVVDHEHVEQFTHGRIV